MSDDQVHSLPWPPSSTKIEFCEFGSVSRVTVPSFTSKFANLVCIVICLIAAVAFIRIFVPDRFVPQYRLTERGSCVMIALFGLVGLSKLFDRTHWWVFEIEDNTLSVHEFTETRQPRTLVMLSDFVDARYSEQDSFPRLEMLADGDRLGSGLILVDNSSFHYRRRDMIRVARWLRDEMRHAPRSDSTIPTLKAIPLTHRPMLSYATLPDPKAVKQEEFIDGIRVTIPSSQATSNVVAGIIVMILLGFLGIGMLASLYAPFLYTWVALRSPVNGSPIKQTIVGIALLSGFVFPFLRRKRPFVIMEHRANHLIAWELGAKDEKRAIVDLTDYDWFEIGNDEGTFVLIGVAPTLGVEMEVFRFHASGGFKKSDLEQAITQINESINRLRSKH